MKFSKFNVVSYMDDKVLVYNLLTTSFVAFDLDTYNRLLNNQNSEFNDVLLKANIIVHDDIDEDVVLNEFIESSRQQSENEFNEIIILTTTACNAQCYYCYEHKLKPIFMTKTTMDNIVEFILKNYDFNRNINLRWFGGEPLLNTKSINYICQKLKEYKVLFTSKMITNGSLFNAEIISKAEKLWNLKSLQITLDGIEHEYNRIKNYKSTSESMFEKVINNVQVLIDNDIKVTIRINYSVDDINRAKDIIDYLDIRFVDKTNLNVYCAALREEGKPAISSFSSDYSPQLALIKYLYEHNFIHDINKLLPRIRTYPCEAWLPKRFFIYPNGDIYKCQHTFSDNAYKPIGNVGLDYTNSEELSKWKNPQEPKKCADCACWLICRGGCQSIREQGKFTDNECYQYKNSLDGLLRLYYKFYKGGN